MNGIEQLHPANTALYIRVQSMLNRRWKYEDICDEIGLVGSNRVNELCEWFIAYRSPKRLPMVNSQVMNVPVRAPSLTNHGVRLAMWQRQHDGARRTREAAGL